MDTITGHNLNSWVLMTPEVSEEVSKFSLEIAEIVTVWFIRNMILCWIKLTVNSNLQVSLDYFLSIQHTTTLNNTTTKNGKIEIELFMTESIHHTILKMRPKTLITESGQLILVKSEWDQEESITFTIS